MCIRDSVVIVPTETRPRFVSTLMEGMGNYQPTWVEGAITVSLFAGLTLLYVVFTRFFPIVPIWETAESAETELPLVEPRRRLFGVRRNL